MHEIRSYWCIDMVAEANEILDAAEDAEYLAHESARIKSGMR